MVSETQTKTTIYFVDDEADYRKATCEALRSRGYQVLEASGGMEALQTLKARAASGTMDIALVVSDWMMPDGDGLELLTGIRSSAIGVPFLLISGAVTAQELVPVVQKGADGVILKPFTIDALIKKMNDSIKIYEEKEMRRVLQDIQKIKV